mgnify:CR=1 FL=1
MTTVSIVGASGYTGGELLCILLDHPGVEIKQATPHLLFGEVVGAEAPAPIPLPVA